MYVEDGIRDILNTIYTRVSDDSTAEELQEIFDIVVEKLEEEVEELSKHAQWKKEYVN